MQNYLQLNGLILDFAKIQTNNSSKYDKIQTNNSNKFLPVLGLVESR